MDNPDVNWTSSRFLTGFPLSTEKHSEHTSFLSIIVIHCIKRYPSLYAASLA